MVWIGKGVLKKKRKRKKGVVIFGLLACSCWGGSAVMHGKKNI